MVKGKNGKRGVKKNKKGYRKGDKIHGRKKGQAGEAAAYMTRAQALKKLQISLADFRRLCILKGIYPRDPKKKNDGKDKTYYHVKDIVFLQHESLLFRFLELKTFMKKYKRLVGRKERLLAIDLEKRKPTYTVHHLVRERYPTFADCLQDLDDGLSLLALFNALPVDQKREIPQEAVAESSQLYNEFQYYVIRSRSLRKVFASIKGYYYQAEISGHSVTWLAPHQFTQELPLEVDFKVMLTFLEFYRTMFKFVNFKLYAEQGWAYPPVVDEDTRSAASEVAALSVLDLDSGASKAQAREAAETVGAEDSVVDTKQLAQEFAESEEVQRMRQTEEKTQKAKTLFASMRCFICREVPFQPLYFVLRCGGATVGWERGDKSAFTAEDAGITHQIVDRPKEHMKGLKDGREYVQPQWVFDSFNLGLPLPVAPFAPGRVPPPHLSPFADDEAEGYVPKQRRVLDAYVKEQQGGEEKAEEQSEKVQDEVMDADAEERSFLGELKAEVEGKWFSDFKREKDAEAAQALPRELEDVSSDDGEEADEEAAKAPQGKADTEERERRKQMMSKKHKRLLQRIESGEKVKKDAAEKLQRKRKELARMQKKAKKA